MTTHPIQPLAPDDHGTLRFKQNKLVNHLLEWATARGMGLNELAALDFCVDDRQQFAQLIGYSLSGFGELSYVDDEAYNAAAHMAEGMDERDARIAALEQKLAELRAARDLLREPMARLLEMHPDDLAG